MKQNQKIPTRYFGQEMDTFQGGLRNLFQHPEWPCREANQGFEQYYYGMLGSQGVIGSFQSQAKLVAHWLGCRFGVLAPGFGGSMFIHRGGCGSLFGHARYHQPTRKHGGLGQGGIERAHPGCHPAKNAVTQQQLGTKKLEHCPVQSELGWAALRKPSSSCRAKT